MPRTRKPLLIGLCLTVAMATFSPSLGTSPVFDHVGPLPHLFPHVAGGFLRELPVGGAPAGAQPSPYCNYGDTLYGNGSPFILLCYTPQELRLAYNYPTSLNGSGQTIVIVDAFGYPEMQSDLNTFDARFGLPNTHIQIVCQGGVCPVFNASDPDQIDWSMEISEDVQTVHALAPGAHIVFYTATTDDDLTLERAALAAIEAFPHSILSQSWGDPELDMLDGTCFLATDNPTGVCSPSYVRDVLATGESAYVLAALEGTTVFASAGDWGADNSGLCYAFPAPCEFTSANPDYPSSSPYVTAVGGTMGDPYYNGTVAPNCGTASVCSLGLLKFENTPSCQLNHLLPTGPVACVPVGYGGEQVWNEPQYDLASGGAPSLLFGTPSYQAALGLHARTTPDVAADAAASGGGYNYWSAIPSEAGWYDSDGTSFGSPFWSTVAALADQYAAEHHRGAVGFINPALYEIGEDPALYALAFHDITIGNNTVAGSTVGFEAGVGWDDASGWGTPDVANLVPLLATLA